MSRNICKYCYRKKRRNRNKKVKPTKIKLVAFDMDGVLADTISSWQHIHNYFNTSNEESVKAYLKGEIDGEEFIKRDISLWNKNGEIIKREELEKMLSNISMIKGTKECISFLKKHNLKTAIISAGLEILAEKIAEKTDIDYVYANSIEIDKKGCLTGKGKLNVGLIYKDKTLKRINKELNISMNEIISVGNSCFDIPMFEESAVGIAFNPKDKCVKEEADYIVEEKDLSKILPIIKRHL